MTDVPLIVLVHGAWHGAWCWAALQADLDGRGLPSLAVDLPGHGASALPFTDLAGDAAHVVAVLAKLPGPVVLVGHSYGGIVIGEAARAFTNLGHLVFVAAFCLEDGESLFSQIEREFPTPVIAGAILPGEEGYLVIDPSLAVASFYAECPPQAADAAVARLCPQPAATFAQPAEKAVWRSLPSTYVLCSRDQAIHPLHQADMAERCSTVVTVDTDHSPFLSATDAVADILEGIARA